MLNPVLQRKHDIVELRRVVRDATANLFSMGNQETRMLADLRRSTTDSYASKLSILVFDPKVPRRGDRNFDHIRGVITRKPLCSVASQQLTFPRERLMTPKEKRRFLKSIKAHPLASRVSEFRVLTYPVSA